MNDEILGKAFPITSVARADLEEWYDVSNVSDDVMRNIARRMAEGYLEGQFWSDLKIIADYLEIPRKK